MLGVNIAWFVLILMALVFIHELGHMVVAKWCGMRVERFSIFFGRPIASFRRGETEYAIGWLPLGGYVKISGMTRAEEVPEEHERRAYYNASAWRKVATIFAGPAVNIVLAFLLFTLTFWIGVPTVTGIDNRVTAVTPESPAAVLGLQPGDRVTAVNGVAAAGDPLRLQEELRASPGEPVRVTFVRDGRSLTRTSPPLNVVEGPGGERVGQLGILFAREVSTQSFGPWDGVVQGWEFSRFVVEENVRVIGSAFTSSEARDQVSSVVGIGAVFDEVADDGLVTILRFTALISLALGLFNLLPLLPLDGGHILFALIEKVRGVAFSAAAYGRFSAVGMALVLLVFVIALQNDIGRLSGEGFTVER